MSVYLITGILGQDGKILSEKLFENHKVVGVVSEKTSDERINNFLINKKNIEIIKTNLIIEHNVKDLLIKYEPTHIINFAGVTNVFNPWDDLDNINLLNCKIPQNFLKTISKINPEIFFVQASSSLMYGRSKDLIINEKSKTEPLYPYGVSKLFSHNLLREYRETFNLNVCSAIFFNHESHYRGENFLSKKVAKAVSNILNGEDLKLELNSLNSFRDISHSDDFMDGIKIICESKINDDFIFSSSNLIKVEQFVRLFFYLNQLDFDKYVTILETKRGFDSNILGDNSKLKSIGWAPKHNVETLINDMVKKELDVLRTI